VFSDGESSDTQFQGVGETETPFVSVVLLGAVCERYKVDTGRLMTRMSASSALHVTLLRIRFLLILPQK
jgi:hypothetical protein